LTFDDGAYHYLEDIVKSLKAVGGKGTFFFNGNNWACIYADEMARRVKYAFDNGFQVASHTWAHKHLTTLNQDQLISEMSRTEDAIYKITGASPAFTRCPYGEYNDLTVKVATSRQQKLVNWDFDSGDSTGVKVEDQKKLYDLVALNRPSNLLSLQHEVYNTSVYEVLPHAISVLKDKYKFVTVAECLGMEPYLRVDAPSARDNSWQC